ncbi:MAG: FkbM family methyltransferase [Anaerolineae bacterium]|nr:FkbM family methyltransferase [Anaerolineae bacterium]
MHYTIFRGFARLRWIRFGIRNRLLRALFNPETISSVDFETNFFGFRYLGNLNSFLDWHVFFYGAYEREFLLYLHNLIKGHSKPIFVDIGANVGHHSLFMSRICEEVHAFEPNPLVCQRLDDKITTNHVCNLKVHRVGLGMKDEKIPFFCPKGCNHGSGSFIKAYSENNEEQGILLNIVNGDNYFDNLALKKISLLKIDVEGYEKYVLAGLQKTIAKYRPYIFMEYSAATHSSFKDIYEFMGLLPPGYTVKKISANRPFLKVFNSPKCILEKFDFSAPESNLLLLPGAPVPGGL